MTTIDPEKERSRLAAVYSEMPDLKLEELAAEAHTLTDPAREALREEISRRQLDVALHSADSPDDHSEEKLVTIRSYRDIPTAVLAQGALESAGIESFLYDENTIRMDWFLSYALGGVKLRVTEQDAAAALEILDQRRPETFPAEGVGEFEQPSCPKCGSLEISFQELRKRVAIPAAYLGAPMPLVRPGWKCHSCGNEWLESEDPLQQTP